MTHVPYPYKRLQSKRYLFISYGKRRIAKVVDFVPLGIDNIMNMGFGDLLPDGSIDDRISSNNGDMGKVLATVIDILSHFTERYPNVEIFFKGSTVERTELYSRILRTYYLAFSKKFSIAGIVRDHDSFNILEYDPKSDLKYLCFLIKRIA